MARMIKSGLIQMSLPLTEGEGTIEEITQAMLQKHLPYIDEAGKKGVQILCLQEIFNTPYFCPGQDKAWYASAESVPGPTTELMSQYAKKYNMVIIVPIYEREQAGFLYNTAAVIDADGTYLGKYRKNHIPHTSGFWEKFFFRPGNLGYGNWNSLHTLLPTVISWVVLIVSVWKNHGVSVNSTATLISWILADKFSRALPKIKTNCSLLTSIWI